MKALQDCRAVEFDFRLLFRFKMPPDDDIDNVDEVWLKMSIIVMSNDHENLCDCNEGLSDIRLLKKISTRKNLN